MVNHSNIDTSALGKPSERFNSVPFIISKVIERREETRNKQARRVGGRCFLLPLARAFDEEDAPKGFSNTCGLAE